MAKSFHRRLAMCALAISFVVNVAVPAKAGAGALPSPTVPVVLVHDAGCSPETCWGGVAAEAPRRHVAGTLLNKGYVPEKTLFFFDYSDEQDPDYVVLARSLSELVKRARDASGSDRVDVVAAGAGCIIARCYVNSSYYAKDIRNLIMLAPPNRGSHLSIFMRLASEVVRHEKRRFSGGQVVPVAGNASPADAYGYVATQADLFYEPLYREYLWENEISLPRARGAQGLPDGFEEWFCASRPKEFQARILEGQRPLRSEGDGDRAGGPEEKEITKAFWEILALNVGRNNHITSVRKKFTLSGEDDAHEWLEKLLTKLVPTAAGFSGGTGLMGAAFGALKEVLLRLALRFGIAAVRWSSYELLSVLKPYLLKVAEQRTALPWSGLAVNRTLRERILFPGVKGSVPWPNDSGKRDGTGAFAAEQNGAGSTDLARADVTVNLFLKELNQKEAMSRLFLPSEGGGVPSPRYVVITESLKPPVQSYIWGDVGEGTPSLEVRSAMLSMGRDDSLYVVDGFFLGQPLLDLALGRETGFLSGGLTANPRAIAKVVGELRDPWEGCLEATSGRLRPSLWTPEFVAVRKGDGTEKRQVLNVEVTCPAQKNGIDLEPLCWLVSFDDSGESSGGPGFLHVPLSFREGRWEGGIDLPEGADRIYLGARLRSDAVNDGLPAHLVSEALRVPPATLMFSVRDVMDLAASRGTLPQSESGSGQQTYWEGEGLYSRTPIGGETQGPQEGIDRPSPRPAGSSPQPNDQPAGEHGGSAPKSEFPGGPPADLEATPKVNDDRAVPLITISRADKMTTTKKENRALHARWEWDFGDGTRLGNDDPSVLSQEVGHRFDRPGRYTVTATSWDGDGQALAKWRWDVEVVESEGREETFVASTINEPDADIRIAGPKEWIVGLPAEFRVQAEFRCAKGHEIAQIYFSPAERFKVLWERPGKYPVFAAVTFRVKASFEGATASTWVTRVARVDVNVLAPATSS